jgi:YHS domain-containing protein
MKKSRISLAVTCLAALFVGAMPSIAAAKSKVNVDQGGVILHGDDAVAYFKQKRPVQGNAAYKSTYQGATYLFASAENKAEFDKNPAKYTPQYGGYCAYTLAEGRLADIDPNNFVIYNGNLYVCSTAEALGSFKAHAEEDIVKDNRNWLQMRN